MGVHEGWAERGVEERGPEGGDAEALGGDGAVFGSGYRADAFADGGEGSEAAEVGDEFGLGGGFVERGGLEEERAEHV